MAYRDKSKDLKINVTLILGQSEKPENTKEKQVFELKSSGVRFLRQIVN